MLQFIMIGQFCKHSNVHSGTMDSNLQITFGLVNNLEHLPSSAMTFFPDLQGSHHCPFHIFARAVD